MQSEEIYRTLNEGFAFIKFFSLQQKFFWISQMKTWIEIELVLFIE